jgi:molecular chaperone GrpE
VLDACDLAIGHGADGVEAIRSALVATLGPVGLEVLDPQDAPFDPTRHEAVLHEAAGEDDGATQVVVEVLRRGYAWEGRVLRPAMVKVRG